MQVLLLALRKYFQAALCILAGWSLAFLAGAQTPTASEPRLALVIGNSAYRSSPLANPVNDARLMEAALKNSGFQVLKAENANRRDMQRLIRDFGEKLKRSGGVGLFYFAGHGMQVRGNNYLIPLDADIRSEDEVAFDSIDAQSILEKMESAGNRVNLLILDACRDNPFIKNSRSAMMGLATMSAPSGSLIAYSTAPGAVANDGTGRNGLYTEHLARMMAEPGLPVEDVFKQVRVAVRRASNNQQTPWENTALEGRFYFKVPIEPAPISAQVEQLQPQQSNGTDAMAVDMAFWDSIKGASKPVELRAYLAQFPNGLFAGLARARLAEARDGPASPAVGSEADVVPARQSMAVATAAPQSSAIAPEVAAPSPTASTSRVRPTVQPVTHQMLVLRDKLTGNELERIDVKEMRGEKGGDGIRWTTGDEVAVDGQVRAVRMGTLVAAVQTGALWRLPLKVGTSGSATVRLIGFSRLGTVNWHVTGKPLGSATVEVIVEYISDQIDPGKIDQNRRVFRWTGEYRADSSIPLNHLAEDRSTFSNSSVGIVSGELKQLTAEAMPPAATTLSAHRPVTDVLILRDKLTGLEEQRIQVTQVHGDSNGTRWTTGDEVAADGQVRAVRLGLFVATAESGALWKLPLQVGTSGSASVRVPRYLALGTLSWRVTGKHGAQTSVEGKLVLPSYGGTWMATYQDGLALAVSHSTEFRGQGGGMSLIAGQLRLSPPAAPIVPRAPGG